MLNHDYFCAYVIVDFLANQRISRTRSIANNYFYQLMSVLKCYVFQYCNANNANKIQFLKDCEASTPAQFYLEFFMEQLTAKTDRDLFFSFSEIILWNFVSK